LKIWGKNLKYVAFTQFLENILIESLRLCCMHFSFTNSLIYIYIYIFNYSCVLLNMLSFGISFSSLSFKFDRSVYSFNYLCVWVHLCFYFWFQFSWFSFRSTIFLHAIHVSVKIIIVKECNCWWDYWKPNLETIFTIIMKFTLAMFITFMAFLGMGHCYLLPMDVIILMKWNYFVN
jgi:hypothetical protein